MSFLYRKSMMLSFLVLVSALFLWSRPVFAQHYGNLTMNHSLSPGGRTPPGGFDNLYGSFDNSPHAYLIGRKIFCFRWRI